MALAQATKEAIYLVKTPILIYSDHQDAQSLVKNPIHHARTKHYIDVRHHFIRNLYADEIIDVKYLSTDAMTADVLTKSLSSYKHIKFVSDIWDYVQAEY